MSTKEEKSNFWFAFSMTISGAFTFMVLGFLVAMTVFGHGNEDASVILPILAPFMCIAAYFITAIGFVGMMMPSKHTERKSTGDPLIDNHPFGSPTR